MNILAKYFQDEKKRLNDLASPTYFNENIQQIAEKYQNQQPQKAGFGIRLSNFFQYHKRFVTVGATALVAIIVAGATLFINPTHNIKNEMSHFTGSFFVQALAAEETENIIKTDSTFLLKSTEPINKEAVKQSLNIAPAIEYELTANSDNTEFTITPSEELDEQTVYSISIDPAMTAIGAEARSENSWLFQTVAPFTLTSFYPDHHTTDVPVNCGIELTFSEEPSLESVKEHVTILPETSGEWQLNGNTAIFIPHNSLQEATIYTVTLKEGAENANGERVLAEEQIFKFETIGDAALDNNISFDLQDRSNNCFTSQQLPNFTYYHYSYNNNIPENAQFDIKIYQFPDAATYGEALITKTRNDYWSRWQYKKSYDTSNLTLTSEQSVTTRVNYGYQRVLYLNDPLPVGLYLAEITYNNISGQCLFQVTDLGGYMTYTDEQMLIWANDLTDGSAAAGAKVTDNIGKINATTDSTGLACIKADEIGQHGHIINIEYEDKLLVLSASNESYEYDHQYNEATRIKLNYWSYLYCDRSLYRPGDELNYFGVLTPATANAPAIDDLKLVINYKTATQTIELEQDTFSGSFTLPNLEPCYYSLLLYANDDLINSTYFEVQLYEKPSYQLKLSLDQDAVMLGEDVTYNVSSTYFDGTPLPGQKISINGSLFNANKTITTDENGEASITMKAKLRNEPSGISSWQYVGAVAEFPEIGSVWAEDNYYCITADVDFEGEAERDKADIGKFNLDLTVKSVNEAIVDKWSTTAEKDRYLPFNGTQKATLTITRREPHKIQDGVYYNPYTKETTPIYRYYTEDILENSVELTSNGEKIQYTGQLDSNNEYLLTLKGSDSKGRAFVRTYYIPSANNILDLDDEYRFLSLTTENNNSSYSLGDVVNMKVYSNQNEFTLEEGSRILFFLARDDIKDYQVKDVPSYSFEFTKDLMPNAQVYAIYFDGSSYKELYSYNVSFDTSQRKLDLEVVPDKDTYKPGDTVTMSLQLKDTAGKPMAGTVNLNLVDEALWSMSDQYINFNSQLFDSRYFHVTFHNAISHKNDRLSESAEGGGEGDGGRTEFRDVAIFKKIKTDSNGKAEVSFQLPDNITSWRVIWHAYGKIDDMIYAGSDVQEKLVATQPFFIDWRFAGPFLTGDQPVLSLRSAGTALTGNAANEVQYTVNIAEMNYSQTLKGNGSSWADLQLPQLTTGTYTAIFVGQYGQYQDKATITFTVLDSMVSHVARTTTVLTNGYRPTIYPDQMVNLTFANTNAALALDGLLNLASQSSVRVEQVIANRLAGELLADKFNITAYTSDKTEQEFREELLNYQVRGFKPLKAAATDLEVSALVASTAGDYVDKDALKSYFNSFDFDNDSDHTLVLWGLAALGEPVLDQINKELNNDDLSGFDQLNLCMALYFAGDGAKGKILTQQLVDKYVTDLGDTCIAKVDEDTFINQKATARLAMLATAYDLPQAEKLYAYVQQNPNPNDYFLLEQYLILAKLAAKIDSNSGFSYTLDKETTKVEQLWHTSLLLTPEQAKNITFSDITGNVEVIQTYNATGLPQADPKGSSYVKMERTYQNAKDSSIQAEQNQLIAITVNYSIDANAPAGYYSVVDNLPAGLRYVYLDTTNLTKVYLLREKGNEITFSINKGSAEAVSGSFTYYVRTTIPGTYNIEPMYLINTVNPAISTTTGKAQITIK